MWLLGREKREPASQPARVSLLRSSQLGPRKPEMEEAEKEDDQYADEEKASGSTSINRSGLF